MTNPNVSRVLSLLAQCEHRQEAGEPVSLDEICKESPELLEQVKAQWELLQGFPAAQSQTKLFDPKQTVDDSNRPMLSKAIAGVIIAGRYQLTQLIGEGGMGSVWRAEQLQPVKRQVAVKLIRGSGQAPTQVIRRFEAERQALAMMDHPGIARIYDGGITEWGDPYFVMELVSGVPLTQYCDDNRLNVKERLGIFTKICQAVQHAHQKGIIHRDLKPGNILVTDVDGKPIPKVIDFGVAKATEQRLIDETLHDFGAVGTLAYMSPEQADAGSMDIDTRSDVYALGVILYELLAGSTPIDLKQFKKLAILELLRIVKDSDPPRLTAKLRSAENLPNLAVTRGTEPGLLTKAVQGDLEWIVMKAMDKDRARRYETANGFAADVERHLNGEAVLAHPPTRGYLLKKFVKRNRARVVGAGLVLATLLAGIVGTSIGLFKANNATEAERKAKQEVLERLSQLKSANTLITSIFNDIDYREIKESGEPLEAILAKRLLAVSGQLEGKSVGDPIIVAELQNKLGQTLLNLGHASDAIPLLTNSYTTRERLLGADHEDTLTSANDLAVSLKSAGKYELSLPLLESTLAMTRNKLGETHISTITSMNNLADSYQLSGKIDKALPMMQDTLHIAKTTLGDNHKLTISAMANLANCLRAAGQLEKALPILIDALRMMKPAFGFNHPDTLNCMNNLAECYHDLRQIDKALLLYEEVLKLKMEKLGKDHPDTLISMNNLALCYRSDKQLQKALELYEKTAKLKKEKLGDKHIDTMATMVGLAMTYRELDQTDKALQILETTYTISKSAFGEDHAATIGCMHSLAMVYYDTKQYNKAKVFSEKVYSYRQKNLGEDHHETFSAMNNLARLYMETNELSKAVSLYEKLLAKVTTVLGARHLNTMITMANLAESYQATGQLGKALPLFEKNHELAKATLDPKHPFILSSMNDLALAYNAIGKTSKAIPLLEDIVRIREATHGKSHTDTLKGMNNLAEGYRISGQLDKAIRLHEETLQIAKQRYGKENSRAIDSLGNLGLAYQNNSQFDKALPLLEETYQLRKKVLGIHHPTTLTTLNNFAECNRAAGYSTKALPLFAEAVDLLTKCNYQHAHARNIVNNAIIAHESDKQFSKAESWRRSWLAVVRAKHGLNSSMHAAELAGLGFNLIQQTKWSESEDLLRQCLSIRQKSEPDEWTTFNTMSLLGGALSGQKRYVDAEPLLKKGYEGLMQRNLKMPPQLKFRLTEALDRLIQLYTETNKPDEVKKWQTEKAKLASQLSKEKN